MRLRGAERSAWTLERQWGVEVNTLRKESEKLSNTATLPTLATTGDSTGEAGGARVTPLPRSRTPKDRILRKNRIVSATPDSPEAAPFRMLRAQVLQRMRAREARTLGICSARDGEGKSTVAINLSICIARDVNYSVLLVDLDLHRPSLQRYLGLRPKAGLDSLLEGKADIDECLIQSGFDRLTLLPVRKPVPQSSDLLVSPKTAQLVHQLTNRHPNQITVFDLPPVLLTDDCLSFLPYLDACLFIAEEGKTTAPDVERALSLIGPDTVIGTVLNRVSSTASRHYYYY